MNYKLEHTGKIVTLFIIIPVLVLIAAVVLIAIKQNLFEKRFHYQSTLENAIGISTQTPVLYKGFEIGRVHSFELSAKSQIQIDFYILSRYKDLVVEKSVLYRTTNPITNKTTLEYVRSSEEMEPLAEGGHIPSTDFAEGRALLRVYLPKASDPIAAIIENIELLTRELNMDNNADKGALMRILVTLADLSEQSQNTLNLVDSNLSEMHRLLANLNKDHNPESGVILRILNNVADTSKSVAAQMTDLKQLLDNTNYLVSNYAEPDSMIIRILDPSGELIFRPLSATLYSLGDTMSDLQKIVNSLALSNPELLLLIHNLNTNLEKSAKTLEALNNNPLLRKAIPESQIKAYAPQGRYHELPQP
ncbi:MAG: MlaD family protein [Candidatus Cloacimonetes bacterium]|nr:MlaD family protein [Candidatus Cloacimonadota bacterium]